ncbi:MAG TPA: 3'(2'),5'-bisphosphate nucleotidase CysQ [Gemmatimonadales bacterium]|jgi:3'(2'), 5'-bisphosphate nucleotidase
MTDRVVVSPDALVRLAAIVVQAGRATLAHYHAGVGVELKKDRTPVTTADLASHAAILEALRAWDAGVPVLSEEGEIPDYSVRRTWRRFWLVDPLDGTKEFLQRNGEFTVNVAMIDDGVPVLGAVYAPALEQLYYAGQGLGSWRRVGGGEPVRLWSRAPLPGQALRVVESRSHPSPELERYLGSLPVAQRIRLGSSLKFCRVAEGEADLYARFGPTREWDVAAGDCIFRWSGDTGERRSPLTYNLPDLQNPGFVIGLDDAETEAAGGAGLVVWFTGLSGSGKSTIARRVVAALQAKGSRVEYLDGDALRELFPGTGFTRPERDAHIRRVGWIASLLERHGVTVVAALVSPYEESRQFVRGLCRRFVEVWISTPFAECARRDVKGLYARAAAGDIRHFTGLDDPYEPPSSPDLVIDTTDIGVEAAAQQVLDRLSLTVDPATRPTMPETPPAAP